MLGAGLAAVPAFPLSVIYSVAISNTLLSAASMMFNDWHDVVEDRVNQPDRPIPSGAVPRRRALGMAAVSFAAGIVAAANAGWPFVIAALGITALSIGYTARLKGVLLVGNVTTALLSAYPVWCWAAIGGFHSKPYSGAIVGLLMTGAGREIVRTAADAAGDAARGIRTVARTWGARFANRLGLGLIILGFVGGLFSAAESKHPAYVASLVISTAALLIVGGSQWRADSEVDASRRLTSLARVLTGLLALAVSWDLIAGYGPLL